MEWWLGLLIALVLLVGLGWFGWTYRAAVAARPRLAIFVYDVVVTLVLVVLGWMYNRTDEKTWTLSGTLPEVLKGLPVESIWFGALGGVVISLKGIYDHGKDWDGSFNLWHLGRPLSAAIAGGVTYVLLLAVNPSDGGPTAAIVWAAAFILGTQERRFFNFLSEVARLIVQVPNDKGSAGLTVTELVPATGHTGDAVALLGSGFDPQIVVTFAATPLGGEEVGQQGTVVAGIVPEGPAAGGAVDVVAANPDGIAYRIPNGFTYLP
jgi:hypothetical protein